MAEHMSSWNKISTDVSNETSVFGYSIQTEIAHYQKEFCATVCNNEDSPSEPLVAACYSGDVICISVEHHLIIFKNAGHRFVFKLDFTSIVDEIACSEDGSIVIAGNRNGDVNVVDANSGKLIVSQQLEIPPGNEQRFFTAVQFGSPNLLLLLTQSNTLHVVDGLNVTDMSKLKHAVIEADGIKWSGMTNGGDIITSSHDSVTVWRRSEPADIVTFYPFRVVDELALSIKRCALACSDTFLIVVDAAGLLTLWSVEMLITLSSLHSPPVDSFVVLDCPTGSKQEMSAILALSVVSSVDEHRKILVYTVPEMACIYSITTNSFSILASPVKNAECLFVVEGLSSRESPSQSVSCLRLSSLSETNPETRLNRLLQKERFSDAEMLAKMFGLDIQQVYRAHASQLLDRLSAWSTVTSATELTSQLISCLMEIRDVKYVLDCCISTALPSLDGVEQLFKLGNHILMTESIAPDTAVEYRSILAELEHRLTTYKMIYGPDSYSGEQWQKFCNVNFSTEFVKLLTDNQIGRAAVMWNRHGEEFKDKFFYSVTQLEALLAMISDNMSLTELRCWLTEGLIPVLLRLVDARNLITALATWIERRAMDLEVTDRSGWPNNALELCKTLCGNVDKVLFKDITPSEYAARVVGLAVPRLKLIDATETKSMDPLVRLHVLVNDLQNMLSLQKTYSFNLPLEEFRAETVKSVAFRMLDRVVAIELINSAITKTIRPYASANGLDPDELLASYVEDLANRHGIGGWHVTVTWESKSIEVMKVIASSNQRHRALLAILSNARFPWEEDVAAAVSDAIMANPHDTSLQGKCRLAKLNHLLISYDLRAFNVSEVLRAQDLAFHIIFQDRKTAVDDSLEVVKFYGLEALNIYMFRCRFLAQRNRSVEIIQMLSQLSYEIAHEIGSGFVLYAIRFTSSELSYDSRHQVLTAACEVLRFLLSSKLNKKESQEQLQSQLLMLENIDNLHSEFGIVISVDDYINKQKQRELFEKYETSLIGGSSDKHYAVSNERKTRRFEDANITNIYRLAELFQVSREEVRYRRALRCAMSVAHFTQTLNWFKSVQCSVSKLKNAQLKVMHIIHTVCGTICGLPLKDFANVVPQAVLADIYQMTCWCIASCNADSIVDGAQLSRAVRLARELLDQCDSGDFSVSPQVSIDPFTEWTFDDFLSDDDGGLVMDAKLVQPLAFQFAVVVSSSFEHCLLPYMRRCIKLPDSLICVALKIYDLLKLNSQTKLLLGYSLECASLLGESFPLQDLYSTVTIMIKRIISQKRSDYKFGLACLSTLPTEAAYDILTRFAASAGVQYKKVLSVAQLGLAFATLDHNAVAYSVAQTKLAEASWGYRLAKLHISFRDAFGLGREEKKHLIPTFARCSLVSVTDVIDYCKAFQLDNDMDAMVLYLKCLMIPFNSWEGCDRETCQGDSSLTTASLLSRAEEACAHMQLSSDKQRLALALEDILDKLGSSDYDQISFVLKWLGRVLEDQSQCQETICTRRSPAIIERDRKLLVYLQQYRIGKGKIPFHQLVCKPWPIITPELTAETVEVWVPVGALLLLNADLFYSTAIRNIVENHVSRNSVTFCIWNEAAADTKLFEVIDRLLSCIVETNLAVMCIGWVARELPPGAEKVLACKLCVIVAKRWMSSCKPDEKQKAIEALNTFNAMYRQISIEQILHMNRLAEPHLLSLVITPVRLIFQLYEHPTIVDRILSYRIQSSHPDIHSAVDQIAAAAQVDAGKIRMSLLDKWLPSCHARQQQESADVTMMGDESFGAAENLEDVQNGASSNEEETDLMRAIYVLERYGKSVNDAAMLLIRIVLEGKQDIHTTSMCQVRALRCLLALIDLADVEKLSERSGWPERLAALLYDGELRRLRVLTSLESFNDVDKSALARAVCRSRDPCAARVAACLAVDFCRNDVQLWAGILRRITVNEVGIVVRCLPWRGQQITSAIVALVSSALSADSLSRSLGISLLSLIQRIPASIDSSTLYLWASQFLTLKMPASALACGMLLPSAIKSNSDPLRQILDSEEENILTEITSFEKKGSIFLFGSRIVDLLNTRKMESSIRCDEKCIVVAGASDNNNTVDSS